MTTYYAHTNVLGEYSAITTLYVMCICEVLMGWKCDI